MDNFYRTKRMFWASRDPFADYEEKHTQREVIKVDFVFNWVDVLAVEAHMNNIPDLENEDKCYILIGDTEYLINESFNSIYNKWKEYGNRFKFNYN